MTVQHFLGIANFSQLVQIDPLCLCDLLFVFFGNLLLGIRNHLFAIDTDGIIAAVDPFLQAIIEASLPEIDYLIRTS